MWLAFVICILLNQFLLVAVYPTDNENWRGGAVDEPSEVEGTLLMVDSREPPDGPMMRTEEQEPEPAEEITVGTACFTIGHRQARTSCTRRFLACAAPGRFIVKMCKIGYLFDPRTKTCRLESKLPECTRKPPTMLPPPDHGTERPHYPEEQHVAFISSETINDAFSTNPIPPRHLYIWPYRDHFDVPDFGILGKGLTSTLEPPIPPSVHDEFDVPERFAPSSEPSPFVNVHSEPFQFDQFNVPLPPKYDVKIFEPGCDKDEPPKKKFYPRSDEISEELDDDWAQEEEKHKRKEDMKGEDKKKKDEKKEEKDRGHEKEEDRKKDEKKKDHKTTQNEQPRKEPKETVNDKKRPPSVADIVKPPAVSNDADPEDKVGKKQAKVNEKTSPVTMAGRIPTTNSPTVERGELDEQYMSSFVDGPVTREKPGTEDGKSSMPGPTVERGELNEQYMSSFVDGPVTREKPGNEDGKSSMPRQLPQEQQPSDVHSERYPNQEAHSVAYTNSKPPKYKLPDGENDRDIDETELDATPKPQHQQQIINDLQGPPYRLQATAIPTRW